MTDTLAEVSTETADLRYVPPGTLVPNPLNPRRELGDVSELAASIESVGVLEPVLAFERDNIDGTLGQELVLLKVPVLVRAEPPESEQLMMMLIENGHRNDLAPIEEARAYAQLVDDGVAQKDIATRLGRSEAHVSKRLAIVQKLPEVVLARFDKGDLSIEAAYALSRVADDQDLVERLGTQKGFDDKWIIKDVDRELNRRDAAGPHVGAGRAGGRGRRGR